MIDDKFIQPLRDGDVTWRDIADQNAGRPGFLCEIGEECDVYDWPGVEVSYGQRENGTWVVRLEMLGDSFRYSSPFGSQSSAEVCACALVRALLAMWPEVKPCQEEPRIIGG